MKPIYSYALLAAFAAVGQALAVDATTTPVGYVSLGNTSGTAVPNNTDIAIGVPLEAPASWTGTVSSVNAGTGVITLTGTPGFTTGQWVAAPGTDPYVVTVTSSVEATVGNGIVGLITANDSGTVTVSLQSGDSLAGIVSGTTVSIRRGITPSSLFAGNTLPNGIQLLLFDGGAGQNVSASGSYSYDSGFWTDDSSLDDVTNALLYPGEGFVLRNQSGTDIAKLVVSGSVPVANHRTVITVVNGAAGQDSYFSYFSPVGEIIGDSGLSALVNSGDQLLEFNNSSTGINKSASNSYSYDSGTWTDDSSLDDVTNTFRLQAGVAYVLRKQSGATTGSTVWADRPSYVPTL